MTYIADDGRYDGKMPYRRSGRSGLQLPTVSLGLWQNFGDESPLSTQRAILRRAFDLGVTHFDLANNYGPPYGSAEINFGRLFREDFLPYRDELVISTKAGYDMWPGPYGEWGSRKYVLASLDQSLKRMGVEYVDIFYSHRFDPDTPLEETMGALDTAVRSGKALYAGISSYSPERTRDAASILRSLGTPLLIHQPSYSMLNRWIEGGLLDVLEAEGAGCIAFSPLAQGLLTTKYLDGVPGRVARLEERVAVPGPAHRRDAGPRPGAELDRGRARPVAGADGDLLDAARPPGDLRPGRRQQRRPAGGEPGGGRQDHVQRRGDRGDRQERGRGRHQHLVRLQRPLTTTRQSAADAEPCRPKRAFGCVAVRAGRGDWPGDGRTGCDRAASYCYLVWTRAWER